MAAIYTLDGNELTTGLQGCTVCDEAIQAAERHADNLGTDVLLIDDDGDWIVHPARDGKREPAEPYASPCAGWRTLSTPLEGDLDYSER